jgi:hypothetical protein
VTSPTGAPGFGAPFPPPYAEPRWFGAIVITAIVVAVLVLLESLAALLGALLTMVGVENLLWSPAGSVSPGMPAPVNDAMEAMREVSMPYASAAVAVLGVAASVWALAAAIRLYQKKQGSPRAFGHAWLALVLAELAGVAFGLAVQVRSQEALHAMFDGMLPAGAGAPPRFEEVMDTVMIVSTAIGVAFALGWGALKVGFALYARHYANSADVRAYVDGA